MIGPDAYRYDSVTIDSDGRHETRTAKVERRKGWPGEEPLFSKNSIEEAATLFRDECDLTDDEWHAVQQFVESLITVKGDKNGDSQ